MLYWHKHGDGWKTPVPMEEDSLLDTDMLMSEFSDTLFSTLSSHQPVAWPNPREIGNCSLFPWTSGFLVCEDSSRPGFASEHLRACLAFRLGKKRIAQALYPGVLHSCIEETGTGAVQRWPLFF